MDKEENLKQMINDLNKVLSLFKKMESSNINDVLDLKKESKELQKELKDRYGKENPPETDSPEA